MTNRKVEKMAMKNKVKRTAARRSAFTLLEVLMVVVILGLLAAFVVPNFFGVQRGAEENIAEATIEGSISNALKMYRLDMGNYPSEDEGGLLALVEPPEEEEMADKWNGPYIDNPEDLRDPWGNEYVYVYPGEYNENGFDLYSPGPDGEPGTEDDIKNWKET